MRNGVTSQNSLRRGREAFTLLELLVVLAIIGLLAAIGLPKLKGIGQANAGISAQRQLLDDIALARQRAIANHSIVFMVFVPKGIVNSSFINPAVLTPVEARVYSNLLAGQYTTYALVTSRQVGDQPGAHTWRYLTDWRTLPDGMFISTNKFWGITDANGVQAFTNNLVPFPLASSLSRSVPTVVFNYLGQLSDASGTIRSGDENIPLVRGSIFYTRDPNGRIIPQWPDVLENPRGNSISVSNIINIDSLTGRARVEQAQMQ
jgi:prepilin-type N-terminal cleavage/methylation domain-containing protein